MSNSRRPGCRMQQRRDRRTRHATRQTCGRGRVHVPRSKERSQHARPGCFSTCSRHPRSKSIPLCERLSSQLYSSEPRENYLLHPSASLLRDLRLFRSTILAELQPRRCLFSTLRAPSRKRKRLLQQPPPQILFCLARVPPMRAYASVPFKCL